MKSVLVLSFLLMSSVSFAETLKIGRFASFGSEDDSRVEVQSVKVTALASTTGPSLEEEGCNAGVKETGQPWPYDKHYTSIELTKKLAATIGEGTVDIGQARAQLKSLERELKEKVPGCEVSSAVGVELQVKIVDSGRIARSVIALRASGRKLLVDTIHGPQDLSKEITIFETPN